MTDLLKPPVILITGATASGKSSAVYSLPVNSPIEIIGADSRQIYKHMSVGTALPAKEQLERFPHHLVSFLDPNEAYSSGRFLRDAAECIEQIHLKSKIPVIVGGTFFYIKTLWDGSAPNIEITEEIRQYVESLDHTELMAKLQENDPASSQRIEPNDIYRLKRALMATLSAKKPFSAFKKEGGLYNRYTFHSYWLDYPREELYNRINRRVIQMFEEGLLTEIRQLLDMGYTPGCPGLSSIGYKEILDISAGLQLPLDHWGPDEIKRAADLIAQHTRNFAKRQLTWLRREKRLKRIDQTCNVFQISELLDKLSAEQGTIT